MPPELKDAAAVAATTGDISWEETAIRLAVAAVLGIVVAAVFIASTRKLVGTFSLVLTLILMTVLVAMTTVVIGTNLARAFGLVGALSIVRFRTTVEDTRDTAFVIFAVVVGMAAGSGYFILCGIGMPIVALLAIGFGQLGITFGLTGTEHRLEVRVGIGESPEEKIAATLESHLSTWRILSIGTAKQGTALDLNYAIRMRQPLGEIGLIRSLQGLPGVMSVEVREL